MGRRRFLQLLSVGGAAAVLAACADLGAPGDATPGSSQLAEPVAAPEPSPWFKDPAPFIEHSGRNLETRLENMQGAITPNRLFFVRNNSASIDVDAARWRLSVEGDAVARPMELSYEEIRGMPSRTLVSYLECGATSGPCSTW